MGFSIGRLKGGLKVVKTCPLEVRCVRPDDGTGAAVCPAHEVPPTVQQVRVVM